MVFAPKMSPGLASLVKGVNQQAAASQGKVEAFVVFTPTNAANAAALKTELEAFAAKEKISVPQTTAVSNTDVTNKFKITPGDTMPVNVLVYRDKKVRAPFVFTKEIKETDVKAVQAAMAEHSK